MEARPARPQTTRRGSRLDASLIRRLARFRYELRRFLRFSERAARAADVTPQQYQLMLGIAGHAGGGSATISELAEFLQQRHNAVVGLVERAVRRGLARKAKGEPDRRFVRVHLTARGEAVLLHLAALHREEAAHVEARLLAAARWRPRTARQGKASLSR